MKDGFPRPIEKQTKILLRYLNTFSLKNFYFQFYSLFLAFIHPLLFLLDSILRLIISSPPNSLFSALFFLFSAFLSIICLIPSFLRPTLSLLRPYQYLTSPPFFTLFSLFRILLSFFHLHPPSSSLFSAFTLYSVTSVLFSLILVCNTQRPCSHLIPFCVLPPPSHISLENRHLL